VFLLDSSAFVLSFLCTASNSSIGIREGTFTGDESGNVSLSSFKTANTAEPCGLCGGGDSSSDLTILSYRKIEEVFPDRGSSATIRALPPAPAPVFLDPCLPGIAAVQA